MILKRIIKLIIIIALVLSFKITYASQPTSKIVGSLTVDSNPDGAEIYIDCINTGETTPYTFHDLLGFTAAYSQTLSTHSVTVRKDGYPKTGLEFVHVKADEPNNIFFDLTSVDTGSLEVNSVNSGYEKTSISNGFIGGGIAQGWQGACWENGHLLDLPFSFPFYGEIYDSVYVSHGGIVGFGSDIYGCSPDYYNEKIIFPFGVNNIATNGTAQPGEDIYISTTTTTVTIRWCGEYEYFDGESHYFPLNFEVVLYNDGEIKFNYGSGNVITDYLYSFNRGISSGDGSSYEREYIYYYNWSSYAESQVYTFVIGEDNGASIYLDGIDTGQTSPHTFSNLIAGTTHYVTVKQDPLKYDYYIMPGQRSFVVIKDFVVVEDFPVDDGYSYGYLNVYNKIPDVDIYVDGMYEEGTSYYTPYYYENYPYYLYKSRLDRNKDKLHWVTVRKDGYLKPGLHIFELDYEQESFFDFYGSDVEIDKMAYFSMDSVAGITVEDINANADTFSVDAVTVTVTSSIDSGETITLTETGNDTGIFEGTVGFELVAEITPNDKVAVQNDEYFAVTYYDSIISTSKVTSSYFNANYTSSDLVLKREITPIFLAYLQTKEEEFLALLESDDKNMGLALIQIGYINLIVQDKLIRGGDILDGTTNILENIESIINDEFSDITWNPGSSLLDKDALEAVLQRIGELIIDEKWENDIAPQINDALESLDEVIANIEPLFTTFVDYEYEYEGFKNIEQAVSDYIYYLTKVDESTGSFSYEVELATEGGSCFWIVTEQKVDELLSESDNFATNINDGMDLLVEQGFNTIKSGYNNDGDTATIRIGRDEIISGLNNISSGAGNIINLLNDEPFMYYKPDVSIAEDLQHKVNILSELVDGKSYPFGDKTICPIAWLETTPDDLTKLIVEYYSLPSIVERSSYTFAGLFPEGLIQEIVDALEPHSCGTFNVLLSTDTIQSRLDEIEPICEAELVIDPNDSKALMTLAIIELYRVSVSFSDKLPEAFDEFEAGDFISFFETTAEMNDTLDSARHYVDRIAELDHSFLYTMVAKYTKDDQFPYAVNINDDIVPLSIPSWAIVEMKPMLDFYGTIIGMISNSGADEDFANFPYDLSLNPNTLNFDGCVETGDYINALRASNPDFLKLKTVASHGLDGEQVIKDIGEDITTFTGYFSDVSEFVSKIAYEGSNDTYFLDAVDEISNFFITIHQDFKYSNKYTPLYPDDHINLSAWFDNVPVDILTLLEDYFVNETGDLGGLFPEEIPDIPQAIAGNDVFVLVGNLVTLDGEQSYDPKGGEISYLWSFASGPAVITLAGTTTVNPTFTPNTKGDYKFKLVVSNGVKESSPAYVWVTASSKHLDSTEGGIITGGTNDKIKVDVPGSTFDVDVAISITITPIDNPREIDSALIVEANRKHDAAGGAGYRIAGSLVEINAYDIATSERVEVFNGNVKISYYYDDSDNDGFIDGISPPLKERYLRVNHVNELNQEWDELDNYVVDETVNCVSVNVNHFSVFMSMGAPSNSSNVIVYPNPYKPGTGGKFDADSITFSNVCREPETTLTIHNIAGKVIRVFKNTEESSSMTWDITVNDSGDKAASGVYIYAIKDEDGSDTTGKFSIIK